MRTAGNILILALFVGGGAAGAYLLAVRNPPLSKRATDAYLAGNYAEAAPLLKRWAQTMNVKNDGAAMGKVLTELQDAEAHLKGIASAQPMAPPASSAPAIARLRSHRSLHRKTTHPSRRPLSMTRLKR